ncbi:MAG TPA: response regulator [Polyangiaceae bacterium]
MQRALPRGMACILVVDDFEDTRSLYAALLRSRGHEVLEAGDGEAALRIAGAELPDAIVMDLSLPVLDGRDAIEAMRLDGRTSHIPIVVVSGDADARTELQERGIDVEAFLPKPCRHDTLVSRIEKLVGPSPLHAFARVG